MLTFKYNRLYAGFIICLIILLHTSGSFAGHATLSWDPPVTNEDGSVLTDLAGYIVYYGTTSGTYTNYIDTGNTTTCDINNLTEGSTHYFAITAYDTSGNESDYSNEVKKVISSSPLNDLDGNYPQAYALEVQIDRDQDDAEEWASGDMDLTSTDLELIHEKSDQTIGMRFNGIDIPRGAFITRAHIQFQVDETSSVYTSLMIEGEVSDNADTFSGYDRDITLRARTSAAVAWEPPAWTTTGEAGPGQRTPDISSVIQEIVDRGGWTRGNSLAIIITGTGKRVAESYNGDRNGAPLLYVEYEEYERETICDDGIDNDGDNLTDCEDPDCYGAAESVCNYPQARG